MARRLACILFAILFYRNKFLKCEDFGFCPVAKDANACKPDVRTDDTEEIVEDDGGWYTDQLKIVATQGPCNIEVLDYLSQQEFLEKYAYLKPFIVKNPNDNSEFKKHSRKENMLKEFGGKKIRLSSANTYSYQKLDVTLEQYVTKIMKPQNLDTPGNETFYWFGDNNHTEWADVFSAYRPPDLNVPNLGPAYSYGAADAGTGVPFHFHGPGFSEVIFGSKRWFLYPPSEEPVFNPNLTTLHWLVQEYPKLASIDKPLECTIRPGEALYFPDRWWHATLNIKSSVFISTFLG